MKRLFKVLENNKVKVFGIMAIILIIIFSFSITPKPVQNDIIALFTYGYGYYCRIRNCCLSPSRI